MIHKFKHKKYTYPLALVSLLSWAFFSCQKTKLEPVETYPEAPAALVKFLDGAPNPAIGSEGSVVTFNIHGLKGKEGKFTFYINQSQAEVVSIEENSIKVRVPANASTGGASVLINGEYYFGPTFTVRGKISIDPLFNPAVFRTNGPIQGMLRRSDGNSYMIWGSFTNYKDQASPANPITGLAILDVNGDYLAAASQLKMGKSGFNGGISTVVQLPDGKYLLSGSFSKYDTVGNINNITRLNLDGTLETMVADVINPDPVNNPSGGQAVVPAFNGGVLGGGGTKIFFDPTSGNTTAVGNFGAHVSTFYERSTKEGPFLDLVSTRQVLRMKSNGALDTTFNFDKSSKTSFPGGNGNIYDVIRLADNNLIIVGNFTTFNNKPARYIARINGTDGTLDENFNQGGAGADGNISRITYNTSTGKILLTGSFKNYNGHPADGVVMINTNGQVDPSFTFRVLEGGIPNYAGQLNNGKILVSGSFTKYDNVIRSGLVVLNPDGSLATGYNNMGLFRGAIHQILELPSGNGAPAVFLVGSFDRFDNKQVGNLVKIRIDN